MSNCKPNFSTLTVLLTAIASLGVGCADGMEGDPSDPVQTETRSSAVTTPTITPLYLRHIEIFEDGEEVGDPEIYVTCEGGGHWARKDLEKVNDTDTAYALSIKMFDVRSDEWPIVCQVWEGDNNATSQDHIGVVTFVESNLSGTSSSTCTGGLRSGNAVLGAAKVKATQVVVAGVTFNVPCSNF